MFPVKSGYEVCQRLKSEPTTRGIKVVALGEGPRRRSCESARAGRRCVHPQAASQRAELVARCESCSEHDWASHSARNDPGPGGRALSWRLRSACCGRTWDPRSAGERRPPDAAADRPARFVHALALAGIGYIASGRRAGGRRTTERIAEAARLIAHGNTAHRVPAAGTPELQAVADAVNDLAGQRSQLLADASKPSCRGESTGRGRTEPTGRAHFELEQSVLVCNREGRVLLYNAAARALLGVAEKAARASCSASAARCSGSSTAP
jgi:PAS domain-containing protein